MEHCSGGHTPWTVPGLLLLLPLLLLLRGGSWAAQARVEEAAQPDGVEQEGPHRCVSPRVAACVRSAPVEVTAALCGGSFYCPFLLEALAEVGVERL